MSTTAKYAVGEFLSKSSTGSQAITGLGFQPKALILWTCDPAGAPPTTGANGYRSLGFTDGTTQIAYLDILYPNGNGWRYDETRVVLVRIPTNLGIIEASITSLDADGFTLNWAVVNNTLGAFSKAPSYVHYLAIGGSGVSAKVGKISSNTSTGSQATTGVGFHPTAVLFLPTIGTSTSGGAGGAGAIAALGFTDGTNQGAQSMSTNGGFPYTVKSYQRTVTCVSQLAAAGSASLSYEAAITSLDTDGFTLNYTTANATAFNVYYLALAGLSAKVGTFNQPTSTGSQVITGTGFQVGAALLASVGFASSTSAITNAKLALGASDGTHQGQVIHSLPVNGQTIALTNTAAAYDSATTVAGSMTAANPASGSTMDAEAALTSLGSDGFTLNWTTADATAREWIYLALEGIPPAPSYTFPALTLAP